MGGFSVPSNACGMALNLHRAGSHMLSAHPRCLPLHARTLHLGAHVRTRACVRKLASQRSVPCHTMLCRQQPSDESLMPTGTAIAVASLHSFIRLGAASSLSPAGKWPFQVITLSMTD